jgi:hypothetical protein
MIILQQRGARTSGGTYFQIMPGGIHVTRKEIYDLLREHEIEFRGKEMNEADELLRTVKVIEPLEGNVQLLNRIIRFGGFMRYIDALTTIPF